jgi:hypothetical protein
LPLFKKHLLNKVLDGSKTQTRRIHRRPLKVGRSYGVRCRRYEPSVAHIKILRASQERLGAISPEDAKKEGFETSEEFRKAWIEIHGSWNPHETVTVYDFQLLDAPKKDKPSSARASRQP